jgi:hypothetical protein
MVFFVGIMTVACGGGNTPPQGGETAPGADRTPKTAALESGASLMQAKAPVEKIAMYLNGFHVSKDDPKMQMEAHHYCNQANEDFAQCVLFDGNTNEARLMGIEYIISEKLRKSSTNILPSIARWVREVMLMRTRGSPAVAWQDVVLRFKEDPGPAAQPLHSNHCGQPLRS